MNGRFIGWLIFCLTAQAQEIRPFLSKRYFACHNEDLRTGNLDLTLAVQPPEAWHKVLDKISTGKMPPPDQRVPRNRKSRALPVQSSGC